MPTYEEVLDLAQRLPFDEQSRLLNALILIVRQPIEVEDSDDIISSKEIVASEAAWQAYRSGEDPGISAQTLNKLETSIVSESALAKDWLRPEEDEAWQDL